MYKSNKMPQNASTALKFCLATSQEIELHIAAKFASVSCYRLFSTIFLNLNNFKHTGCH